LTTTCTPEKRLTVYEMLSNGPGTYQRGKRKWSLKFYHHNDSTRELRRMKKRLLKQVEILTNKKPELV
jgi:hypothetical protein